MIHRYYITEYVYKKEIFIYALKLIIYMSNIIIATLYDKEPVMVTATKFGADSLFLIIDENPDERQSAALETIKNALGKALKIEVIKTKLYDIVDTAKKVVEVMENHSEKDSIIVDITASRKTQSLGLLFAAYKRSDLIKKIVYISEENKMPIELPKLSFDITDSQEALLHEIEKKKYSNLKDLAEKSGMSRAMLYRNIVEMKKLRLIENNDGFVLTDAGRIAIL